MPRYENFLVDPWKGSKEADVINLRRNALFQQKRNQEEGNALARNRLAQQQANADRSYGLRQKEAQRQQELFNMGKEEKQIKTMGMIANMVYRGLEKVKDPQSAQYFSTFLDQLNQTPLAKHPFFQEIYKQKGGEYDPQKVEAGKRALLPFIEKAEGKIIKTKDDEALYQEGSGFIEKGPKYGKKDSGKDNRTAMEKDIDTIKRIFKISGTEAYTKYRSDKSLAERIRLYNNAVDNMDKWLDPEEKKKELTRLQNNFGIDELMKKEDQGGDTIKPPPGFVLDKQ